jgi:hypothetical protein
MRTILFLDDDAPRLVKRYVASRSLAPGKALSELIHRAFSLPRPTRRLNGIQVFDLPEGPPKVTSKKARELQAEG